MVASIVRTTVVLISVTCVFIMLSRSKQKLLDYKSLNSTWLCRRRLVWLLLFFYSFPLLLPISAMCATQCNISIDPYSDISRIFYIYNDQETEQKMHLRYTTSFVITGLTIVDGLINSVSKWNSRAKNGKIARPYEGWGKHDGKWK